MKISTKMVEGILGFIRVLLLLAPLTVFAQIQIDVADVSVAVTPSASAVLTGDNLTYTFVVSNAGPQTATNVSMGGTLPEPWMFSGGSVTQGSCTISAGNINCVFGDIAPGHTATVILTGTIDAVAVCPATMTCTASASSGVHDPNIANNTTASVVALSCRQADVSVAVTPSASAVLTGDSLTYTFVVSNAGPQTATNVSMSGTFPEPWTFRSGSITQGSCAINSAGTIDCSFGDIAPSHTATLTLTGKIDVAAVCPATMTCTASASSGVHDPNIANNTDTSAVDLSCNRRYLPAVLQLLLLN
jgi:large repetitive protein